MGFVFLCLYVSGDEGRHGADPEQGPGAVGEPGEAGMGAWGRQRGRGQEGEEEGEGRRGWRRGREEEGQGRWEVKGPYSSSGISRVRCADLGVAWGTIVR